MKGTFKENYKEIRSSSDIKIARFKRHKNGEIKQFLDETK